MDRAGRALRHHGHAAELRVRAVAPGQAWGTSDHGLAHPVDIATAKPELAKKWQGARLAINDVSPAHLTYPAVSAVVAAGVMPLSGGNFDLLRAVSGAEALEIIGRLEALARP